MAVQNHVPTEAAHPSSWPVFLEATTRRIIENDYRISREEAMRIGSIDLNDALLLFHYANQIREHYHGSRVYLCSIVNAKSGACSEDCAFCSQSAHFPTKSPAYALMQPNEVVQAARRALKDGAQGFSIVISGKGIQNKKELLAIGEIVKTVIREVGIDVHASVGVVAKEQIEYLKSCGVTMLHHNLETSERFFPSICTTHSYQERTATIRAARECGMRVCAGGIFGMGEDLRDRIDMAFELRELGVSAVPMNFLCPIKGTPLAGQAPLPPLEILSIISLYRFILPHQEIKICGGREANLRDLQSLIFLAGADGMMIGNYLTTAGRDPARDWQMMRDLHLHWRARGFASKKGELDRELK